MFAKQHIKSGTVIFSEKPLLRIDSLRDLEAVPPAFDKLSTRKKAQLLSLHSRDDPDLEYYLCKLLLASRIIKSYLVDTNACIPLPDNHDSYVKAMMIVRSNAVFNPPPGKELNLYFLSSRLNHACVPNATESHAITPSSCTVRALRDIAAGEELTISYIDGIILGHAARQSMLALKFRFTCTCAVCTEVAAGSEKGLQSEARYAKIGTLAQRLDAIENAADGGFERAKEAMDLAIERVELVKSEGLTGLHLMTVTAIAVQWAVKYGKDPEKLTKMTSEASLAEKNCTGFTGEAMVCELMDISTLRLSGLLAEPSLAGLTNKVMRNLAMDMSNR